MFEQDSRTCHSTSSTCEDLCFLVGQENLLVLPWRQELCQVKRNITKDTDNNFRFFGITYLATDQVGTFLAIAPLHWSGGYHSAMENKILSEQIPPQKYPRMVQKGYPLWHCNFWLNQNLEAYSKRLETEKISATFSCFLSHLIFSSENSYLSSSLGAISTWLDFAWISP